NVKNYAYGVAKFFIMCRYVSGEFEENIETTEIGFFDIDSLPDNLATDKSTREQIRMCFESSKTPDSPTIFE
ncbi:MAG: ADP-ribose pyrophosphatase, partial [Saccharofermentanales bacterium]